MDTNGITFMLNFEKLSTDSNVERRLAENMMTW